MSEDKKRCACHECTSDVPAYPREAEDVRKRCLERFDAVTDREQEIGETLALAYVQQRGELEQARAALAGLRTDYESLRTETGWPQRQRIQELECLLEDYRARNAQLDRVETALRCVPGMWDGDGDVAAAVERVVQRERAAFRVAGAPFAAIPPLEAVPDEKVCYYPAAEPGRAYRVVGTYVAPWDMELGDETVPGGARFHLVHEVDYDPFVGERTRKQRALLDHLSSCFGWTRREDESLVDWAYRLLRDFHILDDQTLIDRLSSCFGDTRYDYESLIEWACRLLQEYHTMTDQVDRLAKYITQHVSGEPSQREGAIECAIRLLAAHYGPPAAPGPDDGGAEPPTHCPEAL